MNESTILFHFQGIPTSSTIPDASSILRENAQFFYDMPMIINIFMIPLRIHMALTTRSCDSLASDADDTITLPTSSTSSIYQAVWITVTVTLYNAELVVATSSENYILCSKYAHKFADKSWSLHSDTLETISSYIWLHSEKFK